MYGTIYRFFKNIANDIKVNLTIDTITSAQCSKNFLMSLAVAPF